MTDYQGFNVSDAELGECRGFTTTSVRIWLSKVNEFLPRELQICRQHLNDLCNLSIGGHWRRNRVLRAQV